MIAGERLHVRGFPRLNLRTRFLLVDGSCPHERAREGYAKDNEGAGQALLAMGRGDRGRMAAYRRAPASSLTSTNPSLRARKETRGPWNPRPPGPRAGARSYPGTKIQGQYAVRRSASASYQPR